MVSNASPEEQEITLAQILRDAGYITGAIGKWHLSRRFALIENDLSAPHNLGFDYFAGQLFQVSSNYCHLMGDPGWSTDIYANGSVMPPVQSTMGDYLPAQQIQFAIDFFKDSITDDPNRPIFLWVAIQAPFEMHQRPPAVYDDTNLIFPNNTPVCAGALSDADKPPCFDSTLQAADEEIDRLLQAISDEGEGDWWQSTTVILLGDNGSPTDVVRPPFTSTHMKDSLFEGGVRVPFYISGRVVDDSLAGTGAVEESPIQALDLFQTVLDMVGVSAGPQTTDSVSLLPLIDGSVGPPPHEFLYSESFAQNLTLLGQLHTQGDRRIAYMEDTDGEWKLFHTPDPPPGQAAIDFLYGLHLDPWENSVPLLPGLIGDPNTTLYAQKVVELTAHIQELYFPE